MPETNGSHNCSFCTKPANDDNPMVLSPNGNAAVCARCSVIIRDAFSSVVDIPGNSTEAPQELKTPKELLKALDECIVGQEGPKKRVSLAVYNHYKRLKAIDEGQDFSFEKSNMLLIGPTGSGKTLIAETLAKQIDVPFVIGDANSLTAAGYVGGDVETLLQRLIAQANGDISKAERGIIFLDEIDKICRKSENPSITRDVSGEDVQQALLKMIEGADIEVPRSGGGRRHPSAPTDLISTKNILFICAGAFPQMEDIIDGQSNAGRIGFTANISKESTIACDMKGITSDDLVRCGLIPELIGRLPIISSFDRLGCDDLIRILTEPKNSLIKQFKAMLSIEGVDCEFTKSYLNKVAELAIERNVGARGLRSIVEDSLQDLLFNAPDLGPCFVSIDEVLISSPGSFEYTMKAA